MGLVVACEITRAAPLPTSPLQLQDPGVYKVVTIGPGQIVRRREVATSPYTQGRTLVRAVKDVMTSTATIRAYGSTAAELETRTAAMLDAFDQFSFTFTFTVDGVTKTWTCECADYGPLNGLFDPLELRQFQQAYAFSIPRHPVPVTGSI